MRDDILTGHLVVAVDDEQDNLYLLQFLLESYGAEVLTARNGQEGLVLIHEVKPLFVISDIAMPFMDGNQMVYHLKQDPETADIPVVALSANSMLEDLGGAMDAGFHSYLIKPLRPDAFMRDLLQMLSNVPSIAKALGE